MPEKFEMTGDTFRKWDLWKRQWKLFELATNFVSLIDDAGKNKRAAMLVTALGREILELLISLNISDKDMEDPDVIINKLDVHFKPRVNLAYERLIFNRRTQKPDETMEEFINELRRLSKSCDFGCAQCRIDTGSSMIADRIIVGARDDRLRQHLLTIENQSLDNVIKVAKAQEKSKQQSEAITSDTTSTDTSVKRVYTKKGGRYSNMNTNRDKHTQYQNISSCGNCGGQPHQSRDQCPAYGKSCHKCSKLGHFSKLCRSTRSKQGQPFKSAKQLSTKEASTIHMFSVTINKVNANQVIKEDCVVPLTIDGQLINFKLDTGADCNVVPWSLVNRLKIKVSPTKITNLIAFHGEPVKPAGQCQIEAIMNSKSILLDCIVIHSDIMPILGRADSFKHELIKVCNSVSLDRREIELKTMFKDLFDENVLGTITEMEYNIDIKEDAVSVHRPPRRVPITLQKEVKDNLDLLVKRGILEVVKKPTKFVSQLSVVQQKGKLRLCIDPSDLNKAILRRHYPLLTFDEVTTKLHGSKLFRKYDLYKGFWQIPLSKESQLLTTFITPWGRYCSTRMPFGICSAPEIF